MRLMRAIFCLLAPLLISVQAFAVSPWDVVIGETTIADLKAKYEVRGAGIDKYTEANAFLVNPDDLGTANLVEARFIADDAGLIHGIIITVGGNIFADMDQVFSEGYYVAEKKTPYEGDHYARYTGEKLIINLFHHQHVDQTLMQIMEHDLVMAMMKGIVRERDAAK